jgi:hypothetical protein
VPLRNRPAVVGAVHVEDDELVLESQPAEAAVQEVLLVARHEYDAELHPALPLLVFPAVSNNAVPAERLA